MSRSRLNPTVIAAAATGAVIGLAGVGYHLLLRRPLARTRGSLALPCLEDRVKVLRDRWGIPHIYANTFRDLMIAQGFVHAQDRLWQLDFSRRLVAGRLSEVMGDQTLPLDRWMRTLTMRRVAEKEVDLLDASARGYLEAYASGINARIAQGRLPIEFSLLRYAPEPWTVADTLSWIKMMAWMLSVNWESEILRALLIDHLGPELAAELEPGCSDEMPRVVTNMADLAAVASAGSAALDRAAAARPYTGPAGQEGLGSNNWVVAGSRTASGMPLLANDMHLGMSLPSIWYENHLVAGDLNVTGVTFPGIPCVVAGHNGHVAWGYTNGFPDVQDLYVERLRRVKGENGTQDRVEVEFKGEWLEASILHEEIRIKGGATVVEEVIVTHHGPIINALVEDDTGRLRAVPEPDGGEACTEPHGSQQGRARAGSGLLPDSPQVASGLGQGTTTIAGPPLALRWTALEPNGMIQAIFSLGRARNCTEFRECLRHWVSPAQNVVYADTDGNIAYSFAGKIPIRAKGDGSVPVPGWTGEFEWTGYIPYEALLHLYNPSQGYVATANNRVAPDDYPYHLGYDCCTGNRARRIVELIEAGHDIDMDYVKRMQFDQISPIARIVGEFLGSLRVGEDELAPVVDLMASWDGDLAADSPAAAIHEVFCRRLIARILEHKLGDLTQRYAGQGPTPVLAEGSIFGERSWEWLEQILEEPDSHWFDLGEGERRDDVARLALRETVDLLKRELGPDIDSWAWGKLHTLTYGHVFGRVKPLDRLFNRGPFPIGGDGSSIWATHAAWQDLRTEIIVGPPFRFIADLSDLRNSLGLLVPGQSGQPGSRHYDDQIDAWFAAGYHPMLYERDDVEAGAQATLHLVPE